MNAETLTFLFSDIEASTRRWETDPAAMSAALARHDGIVRSAIKFTGGEIFKHTGDGVCAVFPSAPAGMAAALAVQRALQAEDWGAAGQLRVRVALHSGAAEQRARDYFGPTLNRVARLMATAHGGQVVVSLATAELSQDSLPAGATLLDLGEHRLADLAQAEHVFQLAHPDLPADFPPLRSLDAHRHNLPVSPTPFVGRERELEQVTALLEGARLVTFVGVGGGGKTRLALETAGRVLGSFADGVFLVELAPLSDPDLVAPAVVSAVGLVIDQLGPGPDAVLERLAEHLARRRVLIVLDNCEHVVERVAAVADALLRSCPDLTLLATSREPLGVPGEELWRIPSLSLPPDDAAGPDDLAGADAVAFFCGRGRAADPGFRLTGANAGAVAHICRRLDGIPLALELAAARLRLLSAAEVAERLDDRFRLLTAGSRTVLDRHRTLRAAVDWGYELLSPSERVVLGRLSVFAGGFDVDGAEAVVPDGKAMVPEDVLDGIGALVDRSWVVVEPGVERTRYRLLETIRQYAGEKLAAAGEQEDARRRHAEYFRRLATVDPDQPLRSPSWTARVESDLDNVRSALDWFFAAGEIEACLQMTGGMSRFWGLTGRVPEGRTWLERVLTVASPSSPSVGLVAALNGLGFVLFQAGEPPGVAGAFIQRAMAAARAIGDRPGYSVGCGFLGFRALQRGELDQAEHLLREAIEGFEVAKNPTDLAWGELMLGCLASARGDPPTATEHFERVVALTRGEEDTRDVLAHGLANLASLKAASGEMAQARSYADEAVELARLLGLPHVLVMALTRAAETAIRLNDVTGAARHLGESLSLLKNMEGLAWVAYSLELSALITVRREHLGDGARLFGVAHALDAVSKESPEGRPLHDEVQACLAELENTLGAEKLAAELATGVALPVKEAITLALAELAAAASGGGAGWLP